MKLSKLIFLIASVIFFLIIIYFMYDMSTKTTFPGSPVQEDTQGSIEMNEDSVYQDSIE